MSKSIDFRNLKKQYLTVTLQDGTKLLVTTPTKKVLDDFLAMKDSFTGENVGESAIDEFYEMCAKLLSQNKTGTEISADFVAENLDFEDLIVFFTTYTEFIHEVASSKN